MTLTINIWNVSHGLAIHARTPNGKDIVIDAGKSQDFSPLEHMKKNMNIGAIEYAIITHPHLDHIEDIENLINFKPSIVRKPSHISKEDINWDNLRDSDKELVEKYLEFNERYSSPVEDNHEHNPASSENYGGLKIKTFGEDDFPNAEFNDHSIITILEYAGSKILIPGDNEKRSWELHLKNDSFVKAIEGTDVLIAPHHGRESAYYKELFEKINPKLIIISDSPGTETSANSRYSDHARGWVVHNRNGEESKERFVLSTRQDGTIQIKSYNKDNQNYLVVHKK
jgi:beta-lactamase superfamily II metal-dependent hydrolase